jgi:hypothetical protein
MTGAQLGTWARGKHWRSLRMVRKLSRAPHIVDQTLDLIGNINHFVLLNHAELQATHNRLAELERKVDRLAGQDEHGSLVAEITAGRTAEVEALTFVTRAIDELRAQIHGLHESPER